MKWLPDTEGGFTILQPDGKQMSVYDAAMEYKKRNNLMVIAGKEYGTGSSRDWAAKGTKLLGIKAVLAESFERIHRSNLVGMGILPLEFKRGFDRKKLNINWHRIIHFFTNLEFNSQKKYDCEWAAWANGTAVRELDFHDTFLAADYIHPGDNIPAILDKVAQQKKMSGRDLIRGILTGYEVQVNLVKRHLFTRTQNGDHIAHLGPSVAAGLGSLLKLKYRYNLSICSTGTSYNSLTRQSRKGEISSWKAFAPAHAGQVSIEAVDRCVRGEGAKSNL